MSGIELKPINEARRTNILLPLGKTNIGRGSFFGIADKRVSRNHAVFEVEDGKVKVMPIHTNPTFFQGEGGSKLSPLPKDEWIELKHGDRIALTPDEHVFEVVVDERPIVQETQRCSLGDSSPVKQASPLKQVASHQNNGVRDKQKNGQKADGEEGNMSDTTAKPADQDKKSPTLMKSDKNEAREEEDEPKTAANNAKKEEDEEEEEDVAQASIQKTGDKNTVVMDGDKEVALPMQKERKLPDWMANTSKPAAKAGTANPTAKPTPAKKAAKKEQSSETPQKKGRGRPGAGAKAASQPKKTPSKSKSRSRDDDYDDDDYISEEEPAPKRSKASRSQRGSTKVASYAEDDYDDLDEEWVASDLNDDGSDWEMDSQSQSHKKGKGKKRAGNTPKGKYSSPRKRGRPKKYTHSSEEDDDWSDDEAYVPRPTKRRASSSSNSQPTGQVKRSNKKTVEEHDVSEEEEKEEDKPQQNKRTNAAQSKTADATKKKHVISDDDDDDDEEEKPTQKKPEQKKKRKTCQFGKRCYRKNPVHLKDFIHPGDSDYNSNLSDEDGSDDDRLECEHGTSCYRKNAEHLKEYKHTKPPGRPKRETTKKGKKKGALGGDSDDNDAPNTYDYNDSFLNDDNDGGSASPDDRGSEDSDWGPEDSQDVRDLVKEAKGFIKNKKMQKS